jgi:putative methionine-R-sulfoxide reductase with GAF domain
MNFWRDQSLKMRGFYIMVLLSIIFGAEYFIIRYQLNSLTEAERKIDFARSVQVTNQEIALQLEHFLQGKTDIAAELASLAGDQDHLLNTLGNGGRVDGSKQFLKPLSRLPRITYDNLREDWISYKSEIQTLLNTAAIAQQPPLTSPTDSVAEAATTNSNVTGAKLAFESRWLSLARWYDKLIADLEEEVESKLQVLVISFGLFVLLNIIAVWVVFYLFRRNVLEPLKRLENSAASQNFTIEFDRNEIGVVASQIKNTIENLRDATDFVVAIGEGKLDLDYKSLDADYKEGGNKLADSLIEMQTRLKTLGEEERKRQWSNEGLAKFVDILRASNDDLNLLGDKIIASLVQYTKSNQGALYILNDEDPRNKHLELISLFAFDIKKYDQQKIKLGEGILGQTFLEKETTYLTNMPESYIRITSGLGDASPRSLLLVPLKVDTQVYGIIELASFNEYQPHEIAFVEKLGESIASTLASVRAVQKNMQLIHQFQQQTEQMRAQEEEMRQNMEELQATQEEIARKEKSYLVRIKELESETGGSSMQTQINDLKAKLERKEREYLAKTEELKALLAQKPIQGDDWQLASEVEKALKLNLQALHITQEELNRKG